MVKSVYQTDGTKVPTKSMLMCHKFIISEFLKVKL